MRFISVLKRLSLKTVIIADVVLLALIFGVLFRAYAYGQLELKLFAEKDPRAAAQEIFDTCFREKKDPCYKKEFGELTKDEGIFFAQKVVYALQEFDPRMRHCHVLSHEVARIATLEDPSEWKKLLDKVDLNQCGGGFFHGVLEAHTGSDPSFKITPETIVGICKGERSDENEFRVRTCAHILGHLTMIETEGKVEPALPICDALSDTLAYECYNGVFMEDSFKTSLAVHGLAKLPVRDKPRLDRQRARCFKYTGEAAAACWTDMAEIFIEYHDYQAPITYKLCNEAPEQRSRESCYRKAVTLMAVSPPYDKVERLVSPCKPFLNNNEKFAMCYHSMISGMLFYSPNFADRAIKLCSNIPEHHRQGCFYKVGTLLKMNVSSLETRNDLCRDAPQEFKNLCSAG
jgi:hypothetical protein